MSNLPEVKIGVVAVSRDCFPANITILFPRESFREQKKSSDEGLY